MDSQEIRRHARCIGITPGALRRRIKRYGKEKALAMPKRRTREWPADAGALIKKHYPEGGVKACRSFLPGFSDKAIQKKAQRLGVRGQRGRPCTSHQVPRNQGSLALQQLRNQAISSAWGRPVRKG